MTATARSDRLDSHLMVVSKQRYYGVPIALAIIVALCLTSWVMLLRLTDATHRAVTVQVPGLQAQIQSRDQTISDQQAVLNQAVAAITKLARQVKSLGGDPGEVVLKPPEHPKGGKP